MTRHRLGYEWTGKGAAAATDARVAPTKSAGRMVKQWLENEDLRDRLDAENEMRRREERWWRRPVLKRVSAWTEPSS